MDKILTEMLHNKCGKHVESIRELCIEVFSKPLTEEQCCIIIDSLWEHELATWMKAEEIERDVRHILDLFETIETNLEEAADSEVKADTDQSKSFNLCRKGEAYCCSFPTLYHNLNSFGSEEQYILTKQKGNSMDKKIDLFTKEQLMIMAAEFLYAIFSEGITEKEFAIIERELTAFFDENTSDTPTALKSFIMYLSLIFDLLTDGCAEE